MFEKTWNWAGQYRRSDKNLGVHWPTIGTEVRQVCENAKYWIENSVFGLDEIAARLHHSMVSVHPFPNGNGRHTRMMADALLDAHDQLRFTWGRANLQETGSIARTEYLNALRAADLGDFAALFRFARS